MRARLQRTSYPDGQADHRGHSRRKQRRHDSSCARGVGKMKAESLERIAEEYDRYKDPAHTLLHLDHVPVIDEDYQRVDYRSLIERAIRAGYQSVMIDVRVCRWRKTFPQRGKRLILRMPRRFPVKRSSARSWGTKTRSCRRMKRFCFEDGLYPPGRGKAVCRGK